MITPIRHATLPDGLVALTATARGMVAGSLAQAAARAFGELGSAVGQAGLFDRVRSCIALCPDAPRGPDDPDCRYVGGMVFGFSLADGVGRCERPDLPLSGTLAWTPLTPGRHAVFLHRGAYDGLGRTWEAIHRDWVPAARAQLRDAPPLELVIDDPAHTPADDLRTEIWIPISDDAG